MQSFRVAIILIIVWGLSLNGFSQFDMGGGGFGGKDTSSKKLKLAGFPYLNYDRTQEFMYGAVVMGMFRFNKEDTISPKSIVGAMGIGTTTQTWGAVGFSMLYLNEDKWRTMMFGGYFSFNYQFFWSPFPETGAFIKYNTGYTMLSGQLLRRITKVDNPRKLYGGVHGMYAEAKTTFSIIDTNIKTAPTQLNNVGLDFDYDSRNDVYYPDKGFFVESSWDWYADWLGNRNTFNKIHLSVNNYQRIHKRIIQASRFHTSFGVGSVPFEGQEIIGQTDIRGYSEGKQRGNQLFALQTESRIQIWKRISMVAFAGIATTTYDASDFSWNNLWPGAGGGIRVMVMKEEKFNIGLDVAAGRDDWSMSFTMGETF
ncbi:MAG: hypothetical protein CL840_08560 [Crocinitomicaceae bacterium]|mgnify:CR=1 FL=1|nr:hypothetical protein [Crocinitomicaceae bacterium]|tara:strand:- start:4863 stop:5969 length:1107 start_codon:yes stop_codon:yes gene_type:complete